MRFFLHLILLLLVLSGCAKEKTQYDNISLKDKGLLEPLFKYLVWDCQFAYTLYGDKPISVVGYKKKSSFFVKVNQKLQFCDLLKSRWEIWEKYANSFPMNKYLLITKEDNEWLQIFLINREACIAKIKEHLFCFQKVLKSQECAEKIFDQIVESKNIFREGLKKNQMLYGILLGYGEKNALAFHQRYALGFPLSNQKSFHDENPILYSLPMPYFVTFDSNIETDLLERQYKRERERILNIYSNGDFLEITLSQLLL